MSLKLISNGISLFTENANLSLRFFFNFVLNILIIKYNKKFGYKKR